MHIAHIPVDGDITFEEVEKVTLDDLYRLTKADTVEAHGLNRDGDTAVMYMDEEYLARPEQGVNVRADWLARRFAPGLNIGGEGIGGDVVLVGPPDGEGDDTGLSQGWRDFLATLTIDDLQTA